MVQKTKQRLYNILRWSERYTKTDMVYFASSNFWLLVTRGVGSVSGFALTVVFANLISPQDFGVYKYVLATAGVIGAFTLNGLGGSLTLALNRKQENVIPSAFRTGLLWSIPSTIVAFLIACYYFYMANDLLGWAFVVVALTNPLQANLTITKSLFSSTGDFKTATYYNVIRTIVQISIVIALLLLTKNILIIIIAYLGSSVGIGYITYLHSLKIMKVTDDPTHHTEVIHYAKHLSILGTFQLVTAQIDQLLLWHFAGPVALATYSIAQGPARELRTISDNINAMALPRIASKTRQEAAHAILQKTKYLLYVYVPITVAYIVSAPFFFKLFFPKYLAAVFPSQLLALTVVLQSRALADLFIFSHGTIKDRYAITVPGQILKIVMLVLLVPFFGIIGAIISTLLSEFFVMLTITYVYRRNQKTHRHSP